MSQQKMEFLKEDVENEIEDQQLLERIQNDDEPAFNRLFTKYFLKLSYFCYVLVKDKETARDIVQAVFIFIWEKRKELHIHTSLKGYLSASVRKRSLTAIEKQKRSISADGLEGLTSKAPLPDQQLERDIMQQLIISRLPDNVREVYLLRHVKDLKQKEIAKTLKISEKTVEKKLSQIKFYLKKLATQLLTTFLIFLCK